MLVLLIVMIYDACRLENLRRHIHIKFHDRGFRNSNNIKYVA
jgi:hypothetical protein